MEVRVMNRVRSSRRAPVILGIAMSVSTALGGAPPAATAPTGRASAAPPRAASAPSAASADLESLIRELGATDSAARTRAAEALRSRGESALDALLAHVCDPDAEIALRCLDLLPSPADPHRRVEVVRQLIDSGKPEQVEKAVEFLFQEGASVKDAFTAEAVGTAGQKDSPFKRGAPPIVEELRLWVEHERFMKPRLATLPADQVGRQRKLLEEIRRGRMQAAYLLAIAEIGEMNLNRETPARRRPPEQP